MHMCKYVLGKEAVPKQGPSHVCHVVGMTSVDRSLNSASSQTFQERVGYDFTLEPEIKELLAKGYIEPSNSPFGAPIFFVSKKDGAVRMVVDCRALNDMIIKK